MAEKNTVARPYAVAAFRFAQKAGRLAEWSEMLAFAAVVVQDPGMLALERNPKGGPERASALLLELCGERLDASGMNFLRTLVENKRQGLLPEIAAQFEELKKEAESRVDVEVISAFPLQESEQAQLAEALAKRFGKAVNLSSRVDEDLIGGVLVRVGDKVIDGSLRGRIEQLASQLGI